MENQASTSYLPFHAINEFMRDDYRQEIIRKVLSSQSDLSLNCREAITSITRRFVQVPGFRNSSKAPFLKRIKPTAEAFVSSPNVTAVILSAWSDLHYNLQQRVFELLNSRGWSIFPIEVDRATLPGFAPVWPSGETFETVIQAYRERNPESTVVDDDLGLMVVWVSMRLPYGESESEDINLDVTA